ncbi:MAG TPA: glycosyltransferase family 2 protein [Leptolyngbyaceae cyanobacterium M33_DOE_097]|uniref:Glycosyltransferase family 2 protein n=1 Tax=Oscillatoriales cyanobacterium SpSt-418 TaxID=2282169 RepID=A0A7C3PFJ4_9CYAN|nr:glycosyltransferase family 2 protein [Leptolyngbyaceae cyanobacterium M33_DOE_097]
MSLPSLSLPPGCPLMVVIVNYRSANLVVNCLRSLQPELPTLPNMRVVVVENDSGDDSLDTLKGAIATEGWSEWATVLPADYNGGYAYGNNFAIRPALASPNCPPYILLLNPDTAVRPNALKALVDFMDKNPKVGISGSSFEDGEGKPWSIAFRFPNVLGELDGGLRLGVVSKLLSNFVVAQEMKGVPCQVDWLPGASMMVRREVFDDIGLMDEGYFLYYEETDFCLQARRAGWLCWYVPDSRVMHIAGQSTGVTSKNGPPKRRPQYWFDSRRRYFLKNHGFLYAATSDALWIAGYSLWQLRRVVQRKPQADPPMYFSDFVQNSVFFKGGKPPEHSPST